MSDPDHPHWQQDVAYLLYDCSRLLRRRFDERIADLDLREAQWRVIGLLSRSEGLTQTELATLMGIQKAPLGEHLDKLEALGWIERRRDPADRRANRVYLQLEARKQAETINQRFMHLIERVEAEFSNTDWQQLQALLAELVTSFTPIQSRLSVSRHNHCC